MGWVDIIDRDSNVDSDDSIIYTDHTEKYLKSICKYFSGEILLNSLKQDGTGQGPDIQILSLLENLDSSSQFIIQEECPHTLTYAQLSIIKMLMQSVHQTFLHKLAVHYRD